MQSHVAFGRVDAVGIQLRLVIRVGRHQERLARPIRIRVLAVHFIEFLRRLLVVLLLVQQEKALIVELVGGIVWNVVVIFLFSKLHAISGATSSASAR